MYLFEQEDGAASVAPAFTEETGEIMAKRFTDKDIWKKRWYRILSPAEKCFWNYINDNCDNVGVWEPDFESAEFFIGGAIDWNAYPSKCNDNIFVLTNGKWWLVNFCDLQYGRLDESSQSRPIKGYISLLKSHGLWETYLKGIDTTSMGLDNPIDTLNKGLDNPKDTLNKG
jgi:hypothetical protein